MKIDKTATSHYRWLLYGLIITKEEDGRVNEMGMNSILSTDEDRIVRKDLARAQQGLQMRFINQVGPEAAAKIIDIPIVSISSMGIATDTEFHAGFSGEDASKSPTHRATKA